MRKFFILFYLFITCILFAQKSAIEKDTIGYSYHFDLAIEMNRDGEFAELSKIKLISTENDNVEGVCENLNNITVHDFKRGFVHAFKKDKNTVGKYIYEGSSKKLSSRDNNYVKIKKIAGNKYQLKRVSTKTDKVTEVLILNLEDFEYNAANSLHIHDVFFLNSRYLKYIRRKEKGRNFIIKNYQTTYDGKKINYSSVVNTKKIDINLTVPKELKFFPKVKMT